ncbi:type II toxin-antitoxin system RelE/ParE family toxin [Zooshikella sp. RANM57]|uniref:type II toxin-antitoxin system RelE/ParE family toxin n=1 Tax=Zooshikella sp. RANM57 TaxID=3425863 RepID=UPI003D6E5F89
MTHITVATILLGSIVKGILMRIFKVTAFDSWAKEESLKDETLKEAITEIEKGLVDANLGGHVFKKRVAIPGKGKSSGFRTLIAYKKDNNAFFIYGFAKNVKANIKDDELKALKMYAKQLLGYSGEDLDTAVNEGALVEVEDDG